MKKILLIATGGTIASKSGDMGLKPDMGGANMLDYVPQIRACCRVDTVQPYNIDSTNITPEHWVRLASLISFDLFSRFRDRNTVLTNFARDIV